MKHWIKPALRALSQREKGTDSAEMDEAEIRSFTSDLASENARAKVVGARHENSSSTGNVHPGTAGSA
jgi:hypothetical protein